MASTYAKFRPTYPTALFRWLASLTPEHQLAWDCAAGSGQASRDLAAFYDRVIATDASRAQIESAAAHPRVEYGVAAAEVSGLPAASLDLVTVAQALHWFDLDAFYAEARRVLKPGGVLAAWAYGACAVEGRKINAIAQRFYREALGPYWLPERSIAEAGYRTLPFPFQELDPPLFAMTVSWTLPQLLGYFSSWSATARYIAANGRDPTLQLGAELAPHWGGEERQRTVTWPLGLRAGRA